MDNLLASETLMINFDISKSKDLSCATVIRYVHGKMTVIKTLMGEEAEQFYAKCGGKLPISSSREKHSL